MIPGGINIEIEKASYVDFLKNIKEGSVDLILTDPPYAISKDSGYTNTKLDKYAKHTIDFGEWDEKEIDLPALAELSFKALRKGGTVIVFYDLWKITKLAEAFEKVGFKQKRFIQWVKTNPVPINSKLNYLSNAIEIAVSFVKVSKPTFHSKYDNGVYEMPIHREKRYHPTQKPIGLIAELMKKHSTAGDLVVDPFLGSGTTAIVAQRLDRNFKGCDISAEYVGTARDRVEDEARTIRECLAEIL